jgi:hypothetical protein
MEAAAVADIGLTRADFWELTPHQFWAFHDRHVENEIRRARHSAQLMALFANANFRGDQHPQPFVIDNFAPPLPGSQAKPAGPKVTPLDTLTAMQFAHQAMAEKNAPAGSWGKLSQDELDALYLDRHRPYGKPQ